ncbi:hypothetical protein ABKN59_003494 [Abortiporus biennis]
MLPQLNHHESPAIREVLDAETIQQITSVLGTTFDTDNIDNLAHILSCSRIAYHPDWDINPAEMYDHALNATNGMIKAALQKAWRDQAFENIRWAAFWQHPYEHHPRTKSKSPVEHEVSTHLILVVAQAWEAEYQGEHHILLERAIKKIKSSDNNNNPYTNSIAIVQSSGAGKSRMMDELASIAFTLPFNLRPDKDTQLNAYPHPDPFVRNYLVERSGTEYELRLHFHCFFGALFRNVAEELSKMERAHSMVPQQFASEWKTFLHDQKNAFYHRVIVNAIDLEDMFKKGNNEISNIQSALRLAAQQFISLTSVIQEIVRTEDAMPLVLMYFDEAHTLTGVTAQPDPPLKSDLDDAKPVQFKSQKVRPIPKSHYHILLSVLSDYCRYRLFGIFLSTTSNLGELAPPPGQVPSGRAPTTRHNAPFTETPFDCAPNIIVHPGILKRKDCADVRFASRFGRPFYYTWMLQSTDNTLAEDTRLFLAMLRQKLTNESNFAQIFQNYDKNAWYAVVDIRLCLEYEPLVADNKSKDTQVELVAHHMRMVYSVPDHCEYMRSGYPSEPMLAEAAAQQLDIWRQSVPTVLIDILQTYMSNGLLDRDKRGEVVARALLTEAYDRAVAKNTFTYPSKYLKFSSGCLLLDFLDELFEPDVVTMIKNATPENCGGKTFAEAFGRASVRWSHFVRAGDDHIFHTEAWYGAFTRGIAFVCRTGQSHVDFIIPILLDDGDTIKPTNMTTLFVQVKLHQDEVTCATFDATACFRNDGDAPEVLRPYIFLLMNLGVRRRLEAHLKVRCDDSINRYTVSDQPMSDPPQPKERPLPLPGSVKVVSKERVSRRSQPVHPRYWINAVGCSNKVYKFIDVGSNVKYQQVLRTNSFLAEHAREDTLWFVRKMKPFWTMGNACYDWLSSSVLNPEGNKDSEISEEQEGVYVVEAELEDMMDVN